MFDMWLRHGVMISQL